MLQRTIVTAITLLLVATTGMAQMQDKLIITDVKIGSLPPNSLPALAIAIDRGADAVQLELVLTSDDRVIVLGSTVLNELTNVAELYPERSRQDGTFYALDFTLEEIQRLSLISLTPYPSPRLHIPSFAEALGLIRILEQNIEKRIGLVVEIKKSWFHLNENKDLSGSAMEELHRYGYTVQGDNVFLASYDAEELQRVHDILLAEADTQIKLIQLIEDNNGQETLRFERGQWLPYNYDWMFTKFGIKAVSAYADAIGLPPETIIDESGNLNQANYIEDAHILGMQVLVYPFDRSLNPLPDYAKNVEELLELHLFSAGMDGLLTGQGHLTRSYLAKRLTEDSETISPQQQSINRLIERSTSSSVIQNGPALPLNQFN